MFLQDFESHLSRLPAPAAAEEPPAPFASSSGDLLSLFLWGLHGLPSPRALRSHNSVPRCGCARLPKLWDPQLQRHFQIELLLPKLALGPPHCLHLLPTLCPTWS